MVLCNAAIFPPCQPHTTSATGLIGSNAVILSLRIAFGSTISTDWCGLFGTGSKVRIGRCLTKRISFSVSSTVSTLRRRRDGFPDLSDRDDLWRLLLRMSARKLIDKRRHDRRQRRGGDVQIHSLGGDAEAIVEAIGDEPSPEMVLMVKESVGHFFFSSPCRALAGIGGC